MSELYETTRNHREPFGTCYEDYPVDLQEALLRARAYWRMDRVTRSFYIRSRNLEEPLTDNEKKRIELFLSTPRFPYEVFFDN